MQNKYGVRYKFLVLLDEDEFMCCDYDSQQTTMAAVHKQSDKMS